MMLKWRLNTPQLFSCTFVIISIIFAIYTSNCVASDALKINHLTHIYKLQQDQQGFIWLAGQHGLTRFDGERSLNFSSVNPEHPLPFNWIHDFYQDGELLLLATESHGLWSINTKTGRSELIISDISNNSFYDIDEFNNNYYFQTRGELFEYKKETGKVRAIFSNKEILEIVHTNKYLYLACTSGLYRLQNDNLEKIINSPISSITATKDTVVAATEHNLLSITDSGSYASIDIDENISQLTKDNNEENVFTINHEGIIKRYSTRNLQSLHHGYEQVAAGIVRSLLHDSSGVLWLASNRGVERLYENSVINHPKTFALKTNANEISLYDNEIIIGSYGVGLQNLFSPIFTDSSNNNFTSKGMKITSLAVVEKTIYIASFDGVWKFNPATKQVNKLNFKDNNKLILKVRHKNNILYIATNDNGIFAYNLETNKILWNINSDDGLSSSEIIDILPLDNNKIWLATAKGIDVYDPKTQIIQNINTAGANKLVALTYSDAKIFSASLGNGIFIFDQQGSLLAHVGKGISFSGLLNNNDEILASARPGIYRLSTKNHKLSMIENTTDYSFVGSSLIHNDILYASHYSGVLELDLTQKPVFNSNVLISRTTVSGESYLLNKTIDVHSSNDLITLDLASLDYRPGRAKKYQYRINNNLWQPISSSQLTLTGLASGDYNIEIMATNSLGQWSEKNAYTEVNVAYPWYWTTEIKIIYVTLAFFIILLTSWLLYLRTQSIKHIHHLLKSDVKNYGKLINLVQRNLQLSATSLEKNEIEQGKMLVNKSLLALKETINAKEPDNLSGTSLAIAIPFFANYIHNKYEVKLNFSLEEQVDKLNYELRSDVYRIIYEALTSSIFKNESISFNLTLQEVKNKLWLTINSNNDSFNQLNSKINFDLSSYTIRQITNKHHASLNTFINDDGSSQLVISFPLMSLH